MKELFEQLIKEGLTPEQSAISIQVLAEWMEETYPIAGALFQVWLQETAANTE
jgi:hypothetical protein